MATTHDVTIPPVGESVSEAMIHQWHKKDGEQCEVDDVLLEIETDKATVEVVSEYAGKIQILAQEGETVAVGKKVAVIEEGAAGSASPGKEEKKESSQEKKTEDSESQKASSKPAEKSTMAATLSPAVKKMVAEHDLDPDKIESTGPKGRLTKGDVLEHLEKKPSESKDIATPQKKTPEPELKKPAGTGEERSLEKKPMSMLRRRIAERLIQAQQEHAILTTFNEVDMAPVMEIRKKYKEAFKEKHGVGLGFMSFFVKASIEALKAYPLVNSHIDGNDFIVPNYYDVGVAISTDKGLMVPVLRDADKLGFAEVEQNIIFYAEKARSGKIAVEDLSGGTFTITNGGVFGSLVSTPILNPPQSAILGMHKIQERPVAVDGQVVIRPMMYLALSYDHRIVDGKEAVSFLVKIKDCLESPEKMMLGI